MPDAPRYPGAVTASRRAMATLFEVVVWGGSDTHLIAAAEVALDEVQRIDSQLSRYRSDSDLWEINALAAEGPVLVDPRVLGLLLRASEFSAQTSGAFSVNVGQQLDALGISGLPPNDPTSAAAPARPEDVEIDTGRRTILFRRPNTAIDLGAIGKGYAIEQAAAVLAECGIGGALIHGGASTIHAIGTQPDGAPWRIAVRVPQAAGELAISASLVDCSLSVSAASGSEFGRQRRAGSHIVDPRTGSPIAAEVLGAVVGASAVTTDALSTALVVDSVATLRALRRLGGLDAVRVDWSGHPASIERVGSAFIVSHP